jgi:rifampicin phosphotransferase
MRFIRTLQDIEAGDLALVGGKALGLARLNRAGFAVPQAFCITTLAHQSWLEQGRQFAPDLAREILAAQANLQTSSLAVRSSLTVEDGAATSLAGLASTRIGIMERTALLAAVAQIWSGVEAGPVRSYLQQLGVPDDKLAAAVVVQVLIQADVAGVLMTRDPIESTRPHYIVEAAWGLGESVVSGMVIPDRYWLDPGTGSIVDMQLGLKPTRITEAGRAPVTEELQRASCLSEAELAELVNVGRRVQALLGSACDIEWARALGKLWLLQARPITTDNSAEQRRLRCVEIEKARIKSGPRGTMWFRTALAQELPEPTNMTWSILKTLLSGAGGFGHMYRDLGFHPDKKLDESGCYDLICGRLYCNLSREPLFYADGLPLAHDLSALRNDPARAEQAQPRLGWELAGPRFWLSLPRQFLRSVKAPLALEKACTTYPRLFRDEIVPSFQRQVEQVDASDWSRFDDQALQGELIRWINATLCDFARHSLKAGLLAGHVASTIEARLTKKLGAEQARTLMAELAGGVEFDPEADLPGSLRALAGGSLDRDAFLRRFGHRGGGEWELAQPRWGENSAALDDLLGRLPAPLRKALVTIDVPPSLTERAVLLRQMLGLRELARHYFFKGYNIIRRILLELDRRLGLDGSIFDADVGALRRVGSTSDLALQCAKNRRERRVALGLPMPSVLFSDDLQAIGRPHPARTVLGKILQGTPLSPGEADGVAFVPRDPKDAAAPEVPFVLVCACTDPSWVPLASRARGLISETGGLLSHGAILARELGLPAVGGVMGACDRLRHGGNVHIDGASGLVTIS